MNQHFGSELPSFNTDKREPPVQETGYGLERTEAEAVKAVEFNAPTTPPPLPMQPGLQQPAQAQPIASQPVVATYSNPLTADDIDLIEKAWVLKAKEIVARTRQDPYQQNKEVERMKADYLKKRYNKEVKLTED